MESAPGHDDTTESPSDEAPSERRSTLFIVLVLVGIIAASTAIAFMSGEATRKPDPEQAQEVGSGSEIVRGVACPDLRAAAELLADGDRESSVQSIERAGREAEDALQRDGVVFGKPERVALELSFLVSREEATSDARLGELIARGVDACPSLSET